MQRPGGRAVYPHLQRVRSADALACQDVVPKLAVHLIRVGEESGELETMLHKLADIYAAEVETVLKRLVAVIEPSLIVFIGVFIGIIVISLLSAIVGINALAS